jgi:hypothetical protein
MKRVTLLRPALSAAVLVTALAAAAGCAGTKGPAATGPSGAAPAVSATRAPASGLGGGDAQPTTGQPGPTQSSAGQPGPTQSSAGQPGPTQSSAGKPGKPAGKPSPGPKRPDWRKAVLPCPQDLRVVLQRVTTADVTKDGVPDTLVTRSCVASTSYYGSTIEVFDGTAAPQSPRRIGVLLRDVAGKDKPWATKVVIIKGIVTVQANGLGPRSDNACPDHRFTYRYQFSKGQFRLIWRDFGKAEKCLPVS